MNFRTVVLMREKKKEIKRSFPRAGLIKVKNLKMNSQLHTKLAQLGCKNCTINQQNNTIYDFELCNLGF